MAHEQNRHREATLKRVSALLGQGDADKAALESAKMLLEIYSVFLERICRDVKSPDFSVDLIIRCIARKAEESLRAIVTLVEAGQTYSALSLLRPMCEEYLLAEFLLSLNEAEANELLKEKTKLDILQGIRAQGSFFPRAAEIFHFDEFVEDASLPERLKILSSEINYQKSKLRALGQRLSYGKQLFPTAKQMAEKTDNLPIYGFSSMQPRALYMRPSPPWSYGLGRFEVWGLLDHKPKLWAVLRKVRFNIWLLALRCDDEQSQPEISRRLAI